MWSTVGTHRYAHFLLIYHITKLHIHVHVYFPIRKVKPSHNSAHVQLLKDADFLLDNPLSVQTGF